MNHRHGHDPHERWRWEQQREEETRDVEQGGRFARDTGDPRWGTGGMRVDERSYRVRRGSFDDADAPGPPRSTRGPFVGRGPRGYRRSDERIRENVCELFTVNGDLDPSEVEVSVREGEVILSGTVATRAQKRLAEDIADAVLGVVEVHNHLRVERPGLESRDPTDHDSIDGGPRTRTFDEGSHHPGSPGGPAGR
jgi:hypothetical protein